MKPGTDLMVFRNALPEPENVLGSLCVDAQGNHVCFSSPMDRIDKEGKDGEVSEVPFFEHGEVFRSDRNDIRRRRDSEGTGGLIPLRRQ